MCEYVYRFFFLYFNRGAFKQRAWYYCKAQAHITKSHFPKRLRNSIKCNWNNNIHKSTLIDFLFVSQQPYSSTDFVFPYLSPLWFGHQFRTTNCLIFITNWVNVVCCCSDLFFPLTDFTSFIYFIFCLFILLPFGSSNKISVFALITYNNHYLYRANCHVSMGNGIWSWFVEWHSIKMATRKTEAQVNKLAEWN